MMRNRNRPHPVIPDHEVLRKIGGGAYGEVWLARGVTGALRAIKVVWREDFEDERGFEREFEGILKYEPISRDHPALVNILHVGRSSDGVSFYYYVMELGDDVASGQDINPIEYEPRTLRADHKHTPGIRWHTDECIDVGLRLAEALHHLHENGLAHRDVKPSNVIFVNGRAKLADIGLVAARGQMTFVGTEGFVPPEGPGSARADIYSLGKVLYEIATGMDRMDFPELPEDLPLGPERLRWTGLNQIICEVCEPRVSKRTISTAAELAEALRRLQAGKRPHQSHLGIGSASILIAAASIFIIWFNGGKTTVDRWLEKASIVGKDAPRGGLLRVVTTPEGVEVLDSDGDLVGITPTQTLEANIGHEVVFILRKPGYRSIELREYLPASAEQEPHVMFHEMQVFAPPRYGEIWTDHMGRTHHPIDREHVGSAMVSESLWNQFLKESTEPLTQVDFTYGELSENGKVGSVVATTEAAANDFARWFTRVNRKEGYLTADHEALAMMERTRRMPDGSQDLLPFRMLVREIPFGGLEISSEPAGAEVFLNGRPVGAVHDVFVLNRLRPGPYELALELEGYQPLTLAVTVGSNEIVPVDVKLKQNQGVVFGKPWTNGMGMRFVPLHSELMVSIWETRVSDYQRFIEESGHPAPPEPDFFQGPDHPAISISRDDAVAFCEWLTRRERDAGRIALSHVYRLPTDMEWSEMVGLRRESGSSPSSRDARKQEIFPWGADWPEEGDPPVGNFADALAALAPGISLERTITGYDDGFSHTAPVGSYPPNALGIYDLSGNAQEWVLDDYTKSRSNPLGVLRGGGWKTFHKHNLHSGSRNPVPPDRADVMFGFRVVLAKIAYEEDIPAPTPLDETDTNASHGRNSD